MSGFKSAASRIEVGFSNAEFGAWSRTIKQHYECLVTADLTDRKWKLRNSAMRLLMVTWSSVKWTLHKECASLDSWYDVIRQDCRLCCFNVKRIIFMTEINSEHTGVWFYFTIFIVTVVSYSTWDPWTKF